MAHCVSLQINFKFFKKEIFPEIYLYLRIKWHSDKFIPTWLKEQSTEYLFILIYYLKETIDGSKNEHYKLIVFSKYCGILTLTERGVHGKKEENTFWKCLIHTTWKNDKYNECRCWFNKKPECDSCSSFNNGLFV